MRAVDEKRGSSSGIGKNQLTFIGEDGADVMLRSLLRESFRGTRFDLDEVDINEEYCGKFAGSTAAAMTEKALMDMPVPRNCRESTSCKEMRERIYEEARAGGEQTFEL